MASPRVFVSSTCYDLNEIRDSLYSFIESLNYVPVFSDKNDVFYHPDLHTHDSCIKEIETCQLFVLIIGGRFGGNYHLDKTKSIVNAEYETAKHLKIPIFTFIKREVYEDHRQFTHNKIHKPDLYDKFYYSAIEKQEHSINIFNFINEVRKTDTNNAVFSFEYGREVREILLKQFSGLFYDFLWKRRKNIDAEKTQNMLTDLTILGKKTEEIIENIYKKIDSKNAEIQLQKIETETVARKFWVNILRKFYLTIPVDDEKRLEELATVPPNATWIEYLLSLGRFKTKELMVNEKKKVIAIYHTDSQNNLSIKATVGKLSDSEKNTIERLELFFKSFAKLSKEKRKEILEGLD